MRVVAVAGDTVDMTEDGLVINGALQSEPDPSKDTLPLDSGTSFPVKLKKGEVFLMGDNRPDAVDSRQFGPETPLAQLKPHLAWPLRNPPETVRK